MKDDRDVWNAWLTEGAVFTKTYEFPMLQKCDYVPDKLTLFNNAKINRADNSCIHFYTDDCKFERVWREPMRYLKMIKRYGAVIAPDFSLYRELPLSWQIHNTYRGRALGHWWTENGITVIPNVRWGDERTYDFCFDGLPTESVVAVGSHGCVKTILDKKYFLKGFMTMLERISPKTIIVYGAVNDDIFPPLITHISNVEIKSFKSEFALSRIKEAV
jgi:hypothetical protein